MPRGKGYDVVTDRGVVMDTFKSRDNAEHEAARLQRLNEGRAVVFTVSKTGGTGRRVKASAERAEVVRARAEERAKREDFRRRTRARRHDRGHDAERKAPRRRTGAKMDRLNRLEKALMRLEFASRHKQPLDLATINEIKKERDRVKNVFERVKQGRPIDPGRLRRGFRDRLTGIRSSLKTDRMEVVDSEKTVDALDDAVKEIEEAL